MVQSQFNNAGARVLILIAKQRILESVTPIKCVTVVSNDAGQLKVLGPSKDKTIHESNIHQVFPKLFKQLNIAPRNTIDPSLTDYPGGTEHDDFYSITEAEYAQIAGTDDVTAQAGGGLSANGSITPVNLSHFDCIDMFEPHEAACLILGIDPNAPNSETWKAKPLIAQMWGSYSLSVKERIQQLENMPLGKLPSADILEPLELCIDSAQVQVMLQSCISVPSPNALESLVVESEVSKALKWLKSSASKFDDQVFAPREIHRWLEDEQISSHYDFSREKSKKKTVPVSPPLVSENESETTVHQFAQTLTTSDSIVPAPAISNAQTQPLPLTTSEIAFCFAGLKWETENQWKKPLGYPPKWLKACVHTVAQRGVSQTLWSPVLIGAALVTRGVCKPKSVLARFQTKPALQPWLEEWKSYEAEYLETSP